MVFPSQYLPPTPKVVARVLSDVSIIISIGMQQGTKQTARAVFQRNQNKKNRMAGASVRMRERDSRASKQTFRMYVPGENVCNDNAYLHWVYNVQSVLYPYYEKIWREINRTMTEKKTTTTTITFPK